MLKMQYNTNFEIVIQPISSLYDLLPNKQTSTYLKELSNVNNYGEYITTEDPKFVLKDDSKQKLISYMNDLTFTKIIDNREKFEFNFIVLPYDKDTLEQSYPDIDEKKVINIDFTIESIINSIETNIRKIQNEHTDLQYIKIFYHVPLYDNEQLEYRYKKVSMKSPIYYKELFNIKNFEKIKNLPMINNLQINDTIKMSIESLFSKLKKKDIGSEIEFIKFLETLYKYSRNKKARDDIIYKSKFYKVLILYSTDFLDKDITKLNNETYYELPSLSIETDYIESNEQMKQYLIDDKHYIDSKYKKNKDNYKCIGKINKVGYNTYKFTVLLRELIFGNINDTISLYINIESNSFGFIHNYSLDEEENEEDEEDEKETKKTKLIKFVQIQNKKGILKIFDENEIKLLKYNNIDKSSSDNNELNIPKVYKIQEDPLKTYLKRAPTPIDMLNYLISPTELTKYQLFVEQYYPKLKIKKRKLENKVVRRKEDFTSFLKLLFKENALFHLKPRDNQVVSSTQYKMKMDNNVSIYEFNNATPEIYKNALDELFHKQLQTKYTKMILNTKPDFLIFVNLLLQKNVFKKTNYDCKEIKYKILKYTKRLVLGGTLKLKEHKKRKQSNQSKKRKHHKYNKACCSKQQSRRLSLRKV